MDDISLVVRQAGSNFESKAGSILSINGSVGDATAFVGGIDDPAQSDLRRPPYEGFTSMDVSPIGGIDTSEIDSDVESIDQSEDSQELADEMTYPLGSISNSEHDRDTMNLSLHTGFPTDIPVIDDSSSSRESDADDVADLLETIQIPNFGYVIGGGILATQALDFILPAGSPKTPSLVEYLRDEGVPGERARELEAALLGGAALLAIVVTPGELNEGSIEAIAEAHGAEKGELFDSPRYRPKLL